MAGFIGAGLLRGVMQIIEKKLHCSCTAAVTQLESTQLVAISCSAIDLYGLATRHQNSPTERERQQNSPERARERVRERQSDFFEAALFPFFWTVNLDKYSFEFAGGACTALWPRASPCASGRRTASCGLSARRPSSGALARSTCVAVAESCPHVYGRRQHTYHHHTAE